MDDCLNAQESLVVSISVQSLIITEEVDGQEESLFWIDEIEL